MAALERWWAPTKAQVGPDAFDLALLEPGTDPKMDLANSLVALHRVGAAACEASRDEGSLIQNLVAARAAVAPPAVQAVSKCVDRGGAYAGLLVRDVADEAEQAALDLYRQAVAKGVTPTLAAQRVGAVFGVPAGALGSYRALATTPAANPVAIQDAADKVLFAYVEKVCSEELEDSPLELVSKAPAAERERPKTQTNQLQSMFDQAEQREYHGDDADERDSLGRFARVGAARARLGLGGSAPQEVGVTAGERERRVTRQTRKTRQTRQVTTRPSAERQSAPREAAARQSAGRMSVSRRSAERKREILNSTVVTEGGLDLAEEGVEGSGSWMQRIDDYTDRHYRVSHDSYVLHLSQAEWAKLVRNAEGDGTQYDTRMFRLGHLESAVDGEGRPVDYEEAEEAALEEKANKIGSFGDYSTAIHTAKMSKDDYLDSGKRDAMRRRVAAEYAEMVGIPENRLEAQIEDWRQQVIFRDDYRGGGVQAVLTDTEEGDALKVRQIVLASVPLASNPYGDVEFDPNQAYRLARSPRQMYDPKSGIEIETYLAFPMNDAEVEGVREKRRFKKADRPYHGDDEDERDQLGRFAPVRDRQPKLREAWMDQLEAPEAPAEQTERKTRPVRQVRQVRQVRRVRQVRPVEREQARPASRQSAARQSAARKPMSRQSVERMQEEFEPPMRPNFGYENDRSYKIVGHKDMTRLLDELGVSDDSTEFSLWSANVQGQLLEGLTGGYEAPDAVAYRVDDQVTQLPADEQSIALASFHDFGPGEMNARARQLFEEIPTLQQIVVTEMPGGEGWVLYGNGEEIPPVHVVEMDPEADLSRKTLLLNEGVRRSVEMHGMPLTMPVSLGDGGVQHVTYGWRLTRPQTHHWRAVNDPQDSGTPYRGSRRNDDGRG